MQNIYNVIAGFQRCLLAHSNCLLVAVMAKDNDGTDDAAQTQYLQLNCWVSKMFARTHNLSARCYNGLK